ncbi:AIM24 family protein [Streptomonospora wellingtoniae]|uniref:AIM24 family protein n=1 Tax=Streptomonospora wellingtoniae TaxID=3075544 RepID=A0ABU2KYF4_9ACTN|nr:AIM24 family protein [Streptomonospora sp. DSM 45055]MDT0304177.1 AIM24 family protein [Streptomonospora sp. DSM 45055]
MRSPLFDEVRESQQRGMVLQNAKMLKVGLDGEVNARQGSMVAYQGDVEFSYKGSGGLGKFFKKSLTGEGLPLMTVSGRGDVFFARDAWDIHVIDLEGDSLTVNGENVLAFEAGLEWDIKRVEGAGLTAGGLFNTVFTGTGRIAVACHGTPVLLQVDQPTFVDTQSAVAWASSLETGVRRTAKAGALVGRGSGEAFQLAFEGQGFVLVQASEGAPPAAAQA